MCTILNSGLYLAKMGLWRRVPSRKYEVARAIPRMKNICGLAGLMMPIVYAELLKRDR